MHQSRKLLLRASNILKRTYSAKPKRLVQIVDEYQERLKNGEIKTRKHPGIIGMKNVIFPENITKAIQRTVLDTPLKALENESVALANYLKSRHPPSDELQVKQKCTKIYEEILKKDNVDLSSKSPEEQEEIEKSYRGKLKKVLRERTYTWKPIEYDKHMSYKYLVGRSAGEYGVIRRIFEEIKVRNPDFNPKQYFDFGSGVGTGIWAVNDCWTRLMLEYVTVDISEDMNEVARNIIKEAFKSRPIPMERLFQRRYLSTGSKMNDLVLCAYTLFELPSAMDRLRTVLNLWKKTGRFLVLVEHGSNAGFQLLNEARDFILESSKDEEVGHVFAPCPHDYACPRFSTDSTPCNFETFYINSKGMLNKEVFSYVVLEKGKRSDSTTAWPRVVRPVLGRSGHTICRMCCNNGKLQEVIFTKSRHGNVLFNCAKKSIWGDTIPVTITDLPQEPEDINK